tara:strand:+ start:9816 stop:10883 length:1068 start_codon:yes stop_codon:yes gene_type:complete
MLRFADSSWLYLLVLCPLLYFVAWFFIKKTQAKLEKFFQPEALAKLTSSLSLRRRKWKIIMEVFVIALLVFSYARLQMGQGKQKIKNEGIEIMIAFDVSKSMLAADTRPSRLDYAKAQAQKLLGQLRGHKVGLMVFAGNAVMVSPLTPDYSAIQMYLDSISTSSVSAQGTNYQKVLGIAESAFAAGGVETDDSTKVTRVVLLLSDGEDHEEGALTAAQSLKEKGIRVFAMGVGTKEGGKIPIYDKFGYLQGYKKDQNGKEVLTQAKNELLKKIAKEGGGGYYHASYGANHVKSLVADIEKLEKSEFESSVSATYAEYFQYFLFFAILLAMLEMLLSDLAPKKQRWRGRFQGDFQR